LKQLFIKSGKGTLTHIAQQHSA